MSNNRKVVHDLFRSQNCEAGQYSSQLAILWTKISNAEATGDGETRNSFLAEARELLESIEKRVWRANISVTDANSLLWISTLYFFRYLINTDPSHLIQAAQYADATYNSPINDLSSFDSMYALFTLGKIIVVAQKHQASGNIELNLEDFLSKISFSPKGLANILEAVATCMKHHVVPEEDSLDADDFIQLSTQIREAYQL
jgi:hypothetical protein